MATMTVTTGYPDLSDAENIDHAATGASYAESLRAYLNRYPDHAITVNVTRDAHDTTVDVEDDAMSATEVQDWIAQLRHDVNEHWQRADTWVVETS